MLKEYKQNLTAQQLYKGIIFKKRNSPNQTIITFSIYKYPTNKQLNSIVKNIRNKIKLKPNLQVFLQSQNKYLTLLPQTKISSRDKIKPLITELLVDKLSSFDKQYSFLSHTITIYCRLIS